MVFTLTTPLYYVNDKPHLGSTYTTLACDALARFYRLEGEKVIFITGVDEHGQKIQQTAHSNSISPQSHCDKISGTYESLWKEWDISSDRFIRTTSKKHTELVHIFFKRVLDSGDIRVGRQKGWYCIGCEEYKDLPEKTNSPECKIHQRKLEWRDEENLFFCLSKYQSKIEDLVNRNGFICPKTRQKEIINFVSNGLRDFSISRINVDWGISVPGYPDHTFYVWFDALLGYLSALFIDQKDLDLNDLPKLGWPASVHVIGKDILRFHAVYWPAMLMSAGIELPDKVFGHGFLTREGQKMGKSLGNVLDPQKLLSTYGNDAVRWYLLRDIEFGQDGDYQQKRFIDTINNDLSNTIGNLLNRSSTMSRKWFNKKVPTLNNINNNRSILEIKAENTVKVFLNSFASLEFKTASEALLELASVANSYLNEMEPWKRIKNDEDIDIVAETLYNVLETSRLIAYLTQPIIPDLSNRMLKQLSIHTPIQTWKDKLYWGLLEQDKLLPEPQPVMSKLEYPEYS